MKPPPPLRCVNPGGLGTPKQIQDARRQRDQWIASIRIAQQDGNPDFQSYADQVKEIHTADKQRISDVEKNSELDKNMVDSKKP